LESKHCHGGARTVARPDPTVYLIFVATPRLRVAGQSVEI
jgi:hypothetical protein